MLSKLNPFRTNFKARKTEDLISDIFTVTDKAFVLFVLHNELDCWVRQKKEIGEGIKGRHLVKGKRFCDGRSGKKDAWSKRGMDLYLKLVGEVQLRRQETRQFEEKMRARLARNESETRTAPITTDDNDNSYRNEYRVADEHEEMIRNLTSV